MPRLLTKPRASRAASVLITLAVMCCARTAAADCILDTQPIGIGFAPSGSGLAGYLINQLTNTFTVNVFVRNDFVVNSSGNAAVFPCRYRVQAAGGDFSSQENPGSDSPTGVVPAPTFGPTSTRVSLSYTIGPNPLCVQRDIEIRGSTTLEGFSGSPSSPAYRGGYLMVIRQNPRQKQGQPDGTTRCVPDDTGQQHKFTIKTKSSVIGVRG
ncbi:MAG: hypothetical protein ACRD2I_28085 [Vicinamibacterales bacterium]